MSGMPETTLGTHTGVEILDNLELGLNHRYKNQLCNTIAHFDSKGCATTIPAGNKQLALLV